MWRPSEEIQADLNSGSAKRIASGLRDLKEYMESVVDEFELPPLQVSLLKPFGGSPPKEVLLTFVQVLASYGSFHPRLDPVEILYRLAELAVIYGHERIAFEAAMRLKQEDLPSQYVGAVLDRLRIRGLHSDREVLGAGYYLGALLAGEAQVRKALVQSLKDWTQGSLRRAVERIQPELEPSEAKLLFP